MIRRLTGLIVSRTEQTVVIEVGGIGYLIHTPYSQGLALQTKTTLHTYLAVRETALDLYGFKLEDELELFEQLLTLPKIGPKSALQVMTQAGLELIKTAAANNDPSHLSKMSGVGKKTAEKVVSGLLEIYDKQGLTILPTTASENGETEQQRDTIDALVALGYPEQSARKTVQQLIETNPELINTNDIIKEALRALN